MGNYFSSSGGRTGECESSRGKPTSSSKSSSMLSGGGGGICSSRSKRKKLLLSDEEDEDEDDSETDTDELQKSINLILNYSPRDTTSSRGSTSLSASNSSTSLISTFTSNTGDGVGGGGSGGGTSGEGINEPSGSTSGGNGEQPLTSSTPSQPPSTPTTSSIRSRSEAEKSSSSKSSFPSLSLGSPSSAVAAADRSRIKPELVRPSRKKMKSTANYIYNTLFVNGENSDICVCALNRKWHLHKLYLCQSPYFESMFKGSQWRESNEREIEMCIPDANITERALEIALGSFYREEISLVPIEVISVLACASLFSLEGLLAECESVMLENVNAQTVLAYYDASLLYGVSRVTDKCLKWLGLNLMISDDIRLESVSVHLLDKILTAHKHLMIIQVETDLYSLCKKWLFYQLAAEQGSGSVVKLDPKTWQKTTNEFFKSLMSCSGSKPQSSSSINLTNNNNNNASTSLLDHEPYVKYASIFRKIRLQSIVNDLQSLRLIMHDRLIPLAWIEPYLVNNWLSLLFVDQDRLSNEFDIDPNEFENSCLRFGRVLNSETPGTWRWIGFNYGIDLLVVHTNRTLGLKRNTSTMHSPYKGLLSNRTVVRFYYVLKLVELDSNGNEVWSKRTEPACFDMHKNEEKNCVTIEPKVKYPLLLNLYLSFYPPRLNYLHVAATTTANE